ncbi:hypothetical protein [Luteibaculum oceani]|uniref:T9SS type A sorting domain-containing protein n=1 Tax=Luteibaculum oceani TaxID=1294296 RepID=A0A5C6VJT5_9FLAO|nr:hypothetical protein [Luteibaculum oceani]TXC85139.1 hypothetical protein FRX97_00515 [Luteibaculum oceani]
MKRLIFTTLISLFNLLGFGQRIYTNPIQGYVGEQQTITLFAEDFPNDSIIGFQLRMDFDETQVSVDSLEFHQGAFNQNTVNLLQTESSLSIYFLNEVNGAQTHFLTSTIEDGPILSFNIAFTGNKPGNKTPQASGFNVFTYKTGEFFQFETEVYQYQIAPVTLVKTELDLNVNKRLFCFGDTLNAEFLTNRNPIPANTSFELQLSDNKGNFNQPTTIATLTGDDGAFEPIIMNFDSTFKDGFYTLRVKGNNPSFISPEDTVVIAIGRNYNDTIQKSFCNGRTYRLPWGQEVRTSGTYSHLYKSFVNCDSNVTYTLSFNEATLKPKAVFCINQDTVILNVGQQGEGTYYIAGQKYFSEFYPSQFNPGTYPITYLKNFEECFGLARDSIIIADTSQIEATLGELCQDAALDLNTLVSHQPGIFSGENLYGTNFISTGLDPKNYQVKYQYTNPLGCTSTSSINILVNPTPLFSVDSIPDFCVIDSTITLLEPQINVPGNGIFLVNQIQTQEFNPNELEAGEHWVKFDFTSLKGCFNSDSVSFKVNPNPVLTQNSAIDPICNSSDEIKIDTTILPLGGTYSGFAVYADSTGFFFNPQTADSGSFAIEYAYTDSLGCSSTTSFNIEVRKQVYPRILNLDTAICKNGNAILPLADLEGGIFTLNGKELDSILPHLYIADTTYAVHYYLTDGVCETTISDSFSIIAPQEANLVQGNFPVCDGETVRFELDNPNASNFRWFRSIDLNKDSIEIGTEKAIEFGEAGNYFVHFFDGQCYSKSEPVSVEFFQNPQPFIYQEGEEIYLDKEYKSNTWLFSGDTITTDTTYFYPNHPGDYEVLVVDENGCSAFSNLITVGFYKSVVTLGPNPTNGPLKIYWEQPYTEIDVRIQDMSGKIVMETNLSGGLFGEINVPGEQGYFIITITSQGELLDRWKVLKY